jgi:AbrB family looped-hinge helix DNA binding protein
MRITSKGQVTIPQAIRTAAGLLPNTEVEFFYEKGEVLLRPAKHDARPSFASALKSARAVPMTKAFRGKSADEIMEFLRGE